MSKYKSAAKALFETFQPEDFIPLEWLYAVLGLERPHAEMAYGRARHLQRRFFEEMKLFRKELARRYGIMFAAVTEEGWRALLPAIILDKGHGTITLADVLECYRWVHPDRQPELRRKNIAWRLRHMLAKLAAELTHTNWDALTHEERKHHCRVVGKYRRWRQLVANKFGVEGPAVAMPEL
jgi:hypothetical protein